VSINTIAIFWTKQSKKNISKIEKYRELFTMLYSPQDNEILFG
jgi:hypothetical protein